MRHISVMLAACRPLPRHLLPAPSAPPPTITRFRLTQHPRHHAAHRRRARHHVMRRLHLS